MLVFTTSEKVIEMLSFSETELSLSLGDVDKTNGVVASTIKEVIARVLLAVPPESVTVIVQLEYVPSLKVRKVMVLFPLVVEVVPDEHEPP